MLLTWPIAAAMGGERMKSNVVSISRARSVVRRTPARKYLRPVAGRKAAAAPRPASAVTSSHDTPIWLSILALVAITMWPSALVWTVHIAYRLVAW
jgi:hypothetical protein